MDVILKKNVKGIGLMGDIVNVKDGYALNYLFPNGLAVRAIGKSLDDAKRMKEKAVSLKKDQIKQADLLFKKLNNLSIVVTESKTRGSKLKKRMKSDHILEVISQKINLSAFPAVKISISEKEVIDQIGKNSVKFEIEPSDSSVFEKKFEGMFTVDVRK
ncbi:MAG TPA: 50S ribosomal protein L9 [Candidatus Dojkabacteria bacterium]|nr:50S ribosomal protein L9 [Candidatus Dojkabacteria bacterium]HQF36106.1 50S ribosomal protein L9 [Candidatus Dojkabacteria bacterium]